MPSISLNHAVPRRSPPSGTTPSLPRSPRREHVPPQGARPPQLDRSGHVTRLSPGTDGTGPPWPGLWALHLQAPVPALPRCDQGRLVQLWALGAQPVTPGDARACCPKGEAPEEAPELVFLLRPPLSPCPPGTLGGSLQLCGPPSSWRRCCLLPSADPPGSGVRGAGRFPQDPASGLCPGSRVCVCVCGGRTAALSHLCPSLGPLGDGSPWGWLDPSKVTPGC